VARTRLITFVLGSMGLVLGLATSASASAIYAYTGNNYITTSGPYTTSMSINGTITLAAPLPGNLVEEDRSADIIALSFDDGVFVIDLSDVPTPFFLVTTDGAGSITGWALGMYYGIGGTQAIGTQNLVPPYASPVDQAYFNSGADRGLVESNPGSWALIPEPNTALLLAMGLAGFGWLGRAKVD
jgi:PEP-CTERM motif